MHTSWYQTLIQLLLLGLITLHLHMRPTYCNQQPEKILSAVIVFGDDSVWCVLCRYEMWLLDCGAWPSVLDDFLVFLQQAISHTTYIFHFISTFLIHQPFTHTILHFLLIERVDMSLQLLLLFLCGKIACATNNKVDTEETILFKCIFYLVPSIAFLEPLLDYLRAPALNSTHRAR